MMPLPFPGLKIVGSKPTMNLKVWKLYCQQQKHIEGYFEFPNCYPIFGGQNSPVNFAYGVQGCLVGNPFTDQSNFDGPSKIPFAHRMALISDQMYKVTRVDLIIAIKYSCCNLHDFLCLLGMHWIF
jgi:hypothetical protein